MNGTEIVKIIVSNGQVYRAFRNRYPMPSHGQPDAIVYTFVNGKPALWNDSPLYVQDLRVRDMIQTGHATRDWYHCLINQLVPFEIRLA